MALGMKGESVGESVDSFELEVAIWVVASTWRGIGSEEMVM